MNIQELINKSINNFKNKIINNYSDWIDLKITFKIVKPQFNKHKCQAKINDRQCSRKWKYKINGCNLCGLHRSNNFPKIENIDKVLYFQLFYINNLMNSKIYKINFNGLEYSFEI